MMSKMNAMSAMGREGQRSAKECGEMGQTGGETCNAPTPAANDEKQTERHELPNS